MLRIHIASHEIGLRLRRSDLVEVLPPGSHTRFRTLVDGSQLLRVNRLEERFRHPKLETFLESRLLDEQLESHRIGDSERALIWRDGNLVDILGPGLHAFWKQSSPYEVERFEATQDRFEHKRLDVILGHPSASQYLRAIRAGRHEGVVFYRDGELIASMNSGVGAFWITSSELTWASLDLREQVVEVAGQEIMTADRVSLRVSLVLTVRPVDFVAALTRANDPTAVLYREAQLALRAAVGARTLDALLKDKSALGKEIQDPLERRAGGLGLRVISVGLRDVILPGEMKTILNQVIEAEKRAEANLIRRREETAAARSQANTAKLLASQPALERMKELEALQEILKGSNATFVLGADDVLGQVRRLAATPSAE